MNGQHLVTLIENLDWDRDVATRRCISVDGPVA